MKRDFSTTGMNQKWSTDVTEFKILDRKIYLSAIMVLYNKEIIGYSRSSSPSLKMVMDMIKQSFENRKNSSGVIIHSNQGWHYKHEEYKTFLKEKATIQSMSRKANCFDNAVIENFFGTLKSEWFYLTKYESIESFVKALKNYIYYFNNKRSSQVLGFCTPVEFGSKNMVA